ncbi:endonuclease domain-containing protein [Sphingosinicella soli]|uniref:Very-short-patch-repair endonuclease n=1 Tax=Sphingosinicella soli TaxID=333708 RepID=A0A7W7B4F3_9SPHN|nr:DUF559 domain-containing protein [Sphingosinicella soli]MBB4633823.1 very-short-patch-repair endonuclease [Sphingosinicella soli]
MAPRLPPTLLANARAMRAEPAPAEAKLWYRLKGRQLAGYTFTRQVVFGPYIADFACRSERLVVELDGDSHATREAYDMKRSAELEARGYRVLRFPNSEVHENIEGVLEMILHALAPSPSPGPSLAGRGEQDT